MKSCVIAICLVIACSNAYDQQTIAYKVLYAPVPIQKKPCGEVLIKVPKHKVLTVIKYDPVLKCYKGEYESVYGCIDTMWLQGIDVSLKKAAEKNYRDSIQLRNETERKARIEADVTHKNELINKYGPDIGLKIYESKIWLGMTCEMVLESWGEPAVVHKDIDKLGMNEQWDYQGTYLYFENGELTGWKE